MLLVEHFFEALYFEGFGSFLTLHLSHLLDVKMSLFYWMKLQVLAIYFVGEV